MAEYLKHENAVISLAGESCPSPARGTACEEAATQSVRLHGQATTRTAPSVDAANGWNLTACHSGVGQSRGHFDTTFHGVARRKESDADHSSSRRRRRNTW